jgi:hypothetical protein
MPSFGVLARQLRWLRGFAACFQRASAAARKKRARLGSDPLKTGQGCQKKGKILELTA